MRLAGIVAFGFGVRRESFPECFWKGMLIGANRLELSA